MTRCGRYDGIGDIWTIGNFCFWIFYNTFGLFDVNLKIIQELSIKFEFSFRFSGDTDWVCQRAMHSRIWRDEMSISHCRYFSSVIVTNIDIRIGLTHHYCIYSCSCTCKHGVVYVVYVCKSANWSMKFDSLSVTLRPSGNFVIIYSLYSFISILTVTYTRNLGNKFLSDGK